MIPTKVSGPWSRIGKMLAPVTTAWVFDPNACRIDTGLLRPLLDRRQVFLAGVGDKWRQHRGCHLAIECWLWRSGWWIYNDRSELWESAQVLPPPSGCGENRVQRTHYSGSSRWLKWLRRVRRSATVSEYRRSVSPNRRGRR